MLADHNDIAKRLPHAGKMCLLDSVMSISDTDISCQASSHRALDNPLRNKQGLPVTAALEYAAQAMALHANWSTNESVARQGVLAAAHNFKLFVDLLSETGEIITINARHLGGTENGFMYSFVLEEDQQVLASGRATIMYVRDNND